MASTIDNVSFIVKNWFNDKKPENLAKRKRLLLSKMRKRGGFTGSNLTVPVMYGNPQGVSPTFATAKANAGQTQGVKWVVTRRKQYGFAIIDAESIEATKDDKGAFMELVETEVGNTIDEMGRRLSNALYGDGSGSIGQVSTISNTTNGTVVLSRTADRKNFTKGQKLTLNPTKTGTSGDMRSGTITVASVTSTGFVFTGTVTSGAADDYIYNEGSYDQEILGLEAHLPATEPTSGDSLYSVDRSVDTERLSGHRLDQASYPIEENFQELGAMIAQAGGTPDIGIVNPLNFSKVVRSLGSKTEYEPGKEGEIGFEYLKLNLPSGTCKVYADPDCPSDVGYLLQMDTFTLRYLGKGIPHIVTDDGLDKIRQTDADGVEVRGRYWGAMYCTAPGWNGRFSITP